MAMVAARLVGGGAEGEDGDLRSLLSMRAAGKGSENSAGLLKGGDVSRIRETTAWFRGGVLGGGRVR
jgi:hypothetical protein